jgi:hypothetical protein
MTNRLQWDVLVSAQIPVVTSDLPPGASEFLWRKHNPEEISEGAVRRDERSHRGYAKAGVGMPERHTYELFPFQIENTVLEFVGNH